MYATPAQVADILKYGSTLPKDKDKKSLRITPQYPQEIREKRRELGEIASKAKSADPTVRTKIVGKKLYLNGQQYREKLPCPTVKELLYLNDTDRAEALETEFTECTKQVEGCVFVARAAEATTINDVRALYRAIMLNPENLSGTHNIAAYRLYSPIGARSEDGFNDDGDFGFGRTVKDKLQKLNAKNIAVFITRYYGGEHLGPKRFTAVESLVEELVNKHNEKD